MLIKTDRDLLRAIAEYRRIIEDAKDELEALENEAKRRMEEAGVEELKSDEHKAVYQPVTSNRFDSKAFKADYEILYDAYKRPSTVMRFTFS